MSFIRKIKDYYYLVESYRIDGKVRQRNLKYLGKVKPSKKEIEHTIREIKGGKND